MKTKHKYSVYYMNQLPLTSQTNDRMKTFQMASNCHASASNT